MKGDIMIKKKNMLGWLLGIFLLCLFVLLPAVRVRAASDFNLLEAVDRKTPKTGTWQITEQGRRFVYSNGKYPRKVWLKLDGKYYYFDTNGYARTKWVRFKGNRYFLSSRSARYGQLLLGFQKINGKTYFFSRRSGQLLYGWTKINKKWYHFDEETGVMDTSTWIDGRYLQKNGVMAVNTTVDGKYVGEDGYVAEDPALSVPDRSDTEEKTVIFVGDSRTVGMGQTAGQGETYIAKTGEGYEWFSTTGLKRLRKALQKDPDAAVVINLGINDLGNIGHYIKLYNRLFRSYPQADFYLMSVNPIEQKKAVSEGYTVTNQQITAFNQKLRSAFGSRYVSCSTYLKSSGYSTVDGIHYNSATYRKIYRYIMGVLA